MRFGISATSSIFPKNLRTRFRPINVCAIMSSRSIDPPGSNPRTRATAPNPRPSLSRLGASRRSRRLSRRPPSVATVGTGVKPPYFSAIRRRAPNLHDPDLLSAFAAMPYSRAEITDSHRFGASTLPCSRNSPAPLRLPGRHLSKHYLLKLNLGTCLFQLRLDLGGVVLVHAFLHGLRRPFDQVLGFLQSETGNCADFFDHFDLLFAGSGEYDRELGLFLSRWHG